MPQDGLVGLLKPWTNVFQTFEWRAPYVVVEVLD